MARSRDKEAGRLKGRLVQESKCLELQVGNNKDGSKRALAVPELRSGPTEAEPIVEEKVELQIEHEM
jgi:hypothetical protein